MATVESGDPNERGASVTHQQPIETVLAGNDEDRRPQRSGSAGSLKLKDQNGRPLQIGGSDSASVFVLGDRHTAKATQRWADELEKALPSRCRVIRVLDLQDLSRLASPIVKRAIRKQIGKRELRVFLDWKGVVAKKFRVTADVPVIICLDDDGTRIQTLKNKFTRIALSSVVDIYGLQTEKQED